MNIPRAGLLTGLLLFILGICGGIFTLEFLKDAPSITTIQGIETLHTIAVGIPTCAVLIIIGMILSYRTCQNMSQRKAVGWFFFISAIVVIVYRLQYLMPGVVNSWNPKTDDYGDLALAIFVVSLMSFLFPGIIMFAAVSYTHLRAHET